MCSYMYLIVYYEITTQINYFACFIHLTLMLTVVDIFSGLDHRKDYYPLMKKADGEFEICPEMHVNEIHLPHNRHHEVSS